MTCSRCDSPRILSFSGKCSDLFNCSINGHDYDGYVLQGINPIGSGDYVQGDLCLECGQLQGTFPIEATPLELGHKWNNRHGEWEDPADEEPEKEVDYAAYHAKTKR